MTALHCKPGSMAFLPREALGQLTKLLRTQGYTVIGPRAENGVISFGPLGEHDSDSGPRLPTGLRDEQDGGRYRLLPGDPQLAFEYVVGPGSPKQFFFPANQRLFQMHIQGDDFVLDAGPPQVPKLAFIGVRPCELAAIVVQDKVFGMNDPGTMRCESETYYTETRRQCFIVAVNCVRPGGTCFCVSMGTGPSATGGYDLALTELRAGFVVHVGTEKGAEVAGALPLREPTGPELELAELKMQRAREHMGRTLDLTGLKEALEKSAEHPQWDDVAKRCLSCGNCTMVCPTCFCSTVTDNTSLDGKLLTRTRQWESCYTHQFSYTTAGPVRNTIRGRYRHWLRHKLCTWHEQFGCSGCVGCGRCITWCPVGIDLTREAERIRASAQREDSAKAKEVLS